MKFKVLTDRVGPYSKGQEIEVDPNKSRVAIEQTYKTLFNMVESGEAKIIEEGLKKTTVGFGISKPAKKVKKSKK